MTQGLKNKGNFPVDPASSGQIGVNETGTGQQSDTSLTQPGSRPVRYRLIDKDGKAAPMTFGTAQAAANHAKQMWPDQEQDETRSGKGWDIEVCA